MLPSSPAAARELLVRLGAPPRLLRHVELVGEAADTLLSELANVGVSVREDFVRVGVMLHDAGKISYPTELDQSGNQHEPAGEELLLAHGVSPELARVCVSHARWDTTTPSLEEILIALADTLWKGVRKSDLEERVIDSVASVTGRHRWEIFIQFDTVFENVAASGEQRLARSVLGSAAQGRITTA